MNREEAQDIFATTWLGITITTTHGEILVNDHNADFVVQPD